MKFKNVGVILMLIGTWMMFKYGLHSSGNGWFGFWVFFLGLNTFGLGLTRAKDKPNTN